MDVSRIYSKEVGCGLGSTDSKWSKVVDSGEHGKGLSFSVIFSRRVLFFRVT
jgi:hypothetical protein